MKLQATAEAGGGYWYFAQGDEVEFQVRSRREADGPIITGRVSEIGTVLGAPYLVVKGRRYMLSDLRTFRNLTMGR
jgi:hypothetical protein